MSEVNPELQKVLHELLTIAEEQHTDLSKLLEILRLLENAHRTIVDQFFMPALPNSRHELFKLLLEIEANGGWPYIYRIRLQQFCELLKDGEGSN